MDEFHKVADVIWAKLDNGLRRNLRHDAGQFYVPSDPHLNPEEALCVTEMLYLCVDLVFILLQIFVLAHEPALLVRA